MSTFSPVHQAEIRRMLVPILSAPCPPRRYYPSEGQQDEHTFRSGGDDGVNLRDAFNSQVVEFERKDEPMYVNHSRVTYTVSFKGVTTTFSRQKYATNAKGSVTKEKVAKQIAEVVLDFLKKLLGKNDPEILRPLYLLGLKRVGKAAYHCRLAYDSDLAHGMAAPLRQLIIGDSTAISPMDTDFAYQATQPDRSHDIHAVSSPRGLAVFPANLITTSTSVHNYRPLENILSEPVASGSAYAPMMERAPDSYTQVMGWVPGLGPQVSGGYSQFPDESREVQVQILNSLIGWLDQGQRLVGELQAMIR